MLLWSQVMNDKYIKNRIEKKRARKKSNDVIIK